MKGRAVNERERGQVSSIQSCVQTKEQWVALPWAALPWTQKQRFGMAPHTAGTRIIEDSGSLDLNGGLTVLGQRPQTNKVTAMAAKNLHRAGVGMRVAVGE